VVGCTTQALQGAPLDRWSGAEAPTPAAAAAAAAERRWRLQRRWWLVSSGRVHDTGPNPSNFAARKTAKYYFWRNMSTFRPENRPARVGGIDDAVDVRSALHEDQAAIKNRVLAPKPNKLPKKLGRREDVGPTRSLRIGGQKAQPFLPARSGLGGLRRAGDDVSPRRSEQATLGHHHRAITEATKDTALRTHLPPPPPSSQQTTTPSTTSPT
jgi:hypothetical protein